MKKGILTLTLLGVTGILGFSFAGDAAAFHGEGPGKHANRPIVECHKHPEACKGAKLEAMADAIGITPDQLKEEFEAGKTVKDILEEKGMSLEEFQEKMKASRKDELHERREEWKEKRGEWIENRKEKRQDWLEMRKEKREDWKEDREERRENFCEKHPGFCFWK